MRARRTAVALALAGLVLAVFGLPLARGERTQKGTLIVGLDGGVSPRTLPRDHPAPVSMRLSGDLRTANGSLLPRVTRMELGIAGQGRLFTRGLPVCPGARLRSANNRQAVDRCRAALVGRGKLEAEVLVPHQTPFKLRLRLQAFNGRTEAGDLAILLHGFSSNPPMSVVVPFVVHHRPGTFPTALVADLGRSLGPWPHLARFEVVLSRRFVYQGRRQSLLSVSCPLPPRFSAGFFTLARSTYTLAGGGRIATTIVRGCRAR